jgi:hypothetical protein
MTYDEIIAALKHGKCESTVTALERAVEDEARALAELSGGQWKRRDAGKYARECAREFYAEDVERVLVEHEEPTPDRILSRRRFAIAWAVAKVLRTNGLDWD